MQSSQKLRSENTSTRRQFLKQGTTTAVAGAALGTSLGTHVFAAGSDTLKVGLIGCGGRGTGAANQALSADPNTRLHAMGDAFPDRLEKSLKTLSSQPIGSRVDVAADRKFVGFDAYKQVIDCCDVVLLATPPHFRPAHLRAAVNAGKHVFCEKPVAVDAPGVHSVLESARIAKQKNLTLVSGLCWRYHYGMRETFDQVLEGKLGEIVTMQCSYNTRGLWKAPRQANWSDMEWQLRNWLYFNWLSGDFITEQHIHSLDKMTWAMGDAAPIKASGTGGRQTRTSNEYGHVFDHFAIVYEYANGVKAFSRCRQQDGCDVDVSDHIMCSGGRADVFKHRTSDLKGNPLWRFRGKKNNMYQTEHDEMFAAIRSGTPINNGDYMSKSTMVAIMGRMSAYTGKTVTWKQAMDSTEDLTPSKYDWTDLEMPEVAMPGITPFA